ncbi:MULTISPECIES: DUF4347 domain-containing protein [unclassified Cyanobium]|uniref:DUF4347 domain-containing protein n=1 Tax=unclassified Cyanobium TaxID=2627006 RepID=UPI0020CCF4F3|nr:MULTISPECIES: DUF4347 domain-containing protein [unclassified Cyanobium]MCP9859372.1 DUF4347 domain-containing protein [Cyanobium sp. Cruz-8H5]MCP9866517.1 DUF4347 domain-containing protein [Cyanobium sp. Cruz-8D1]
MSSYHFEGQLLPESHPLTSEAEHGLFLLSSGRAAILPAEPQREVFFVMDDAGGSLMGLGQGLREAQHLVRQLSAEQGLNDLVNDLETLAPAGGFKAIHILSHGTAGAVQLGRDILTGASLDHYASELARLGELLSAEGDLLLYGCDVGRGEIGATLIQGIAKVTGADVAASSDTTGFAEGQSLWNWDLEVNSGNIDLDRSATFASLNWQGSLAAPAIFAGLKFLGEVVAGAFAGYAVEQVFSSNDQSASNSIVLAPSFVNPKEDGSKPPQVNTGIKPGTFVTSALYLDSTGDLVDIKLTGKGSFKLALAGGLTNLADALSLELKGTDANSGLSISVTPIQQSINAGSITSANSTTGLAQVSGLYNRMYSPGYTNLDRIFTGARNGAIGDIELTAAIVNNIDLSGHSIGSIELDTGYTPLVDRVNTTTLGSSSGITTTVTGNTITGNTTGDGEIVDFAIIDDDANISAGGGGNAYRPTTGLIDLGNVTAKSIDRLIINGSISAPTGDPNDKSGNTNDIRGVVNVSGRIGSIEARRSRLDGTVRAGSIGNVVLGRIDGTVTTTDTSQALSLTLPGNFSGFINSAGHLNMAYTFRPIIGDPDKDQQSGPTIGKISSKGGISGILASETDTIFIPTGYKGVVENTSQAKGIADISVNGQLSSRWISKSSIGNIKANTITAAAIIEADKDIGTVEALRYVKVPKLVDADIPKLEPVELDGTFISHKGSIGNIRSAAGIDANFRAGINIGSITALNGGINSKLIEAGQNIGLISAQVQTLNSTKVVAQKGNIGGLKIYNGDWGGVIRAGAMNSGNTGNIGNIYVEKGSLQNVSLAAKGSVGSITVKGSSTIVGGTYSAGTKMGTITASAARGVAIQGSLFQAGDERGQYVDDKGVRQTSSIRGFTVEAHGATQLPSVSPGLPAEPAVEAAHGLQNVQILAGAIIGDIRSLARTGTGILNTVIHAKVGDIRSITGIGNGHGMAGLTVVAQRNLGNVTGLSEMKGQGIEASRFNANAGSIGNVVGRGGVAGGHGIHDSTIQAAGEIKGLKGTSNANSGDGIRLLDARAGVFGSIAAEVLGGKGGRPTNPLGGGIVLSEFKGYADTTAEFISYADKPTDKVKNPYYKRNGINSIIVNVLSIYGRGIDTSEFDVKGGIGLINSRAFANSAIFDSEFTANYGSLQQIVAESLNAGNAIDGSTFIAANGAIGIGKLGLSAKAGGLRPIDHGINASTFEASEDIGLITASSKGGAAINGSDFEADSDFDNIGTIKSIKAVSLGENIQDSLAIRGSDFIAARIQAIEAKVEDFDGGAAISGSSFTARTATYNPSSGAFNNRGTINSIKVVNSSRVGNGIETSQFIAGAAGSIGSIDVDVIGNKAERSVKEPGFNQGASGRAIHRSEFRASALDADQTELTGRIGSITVKAGRVIPEIVPNLLLPPNRIPPNDQATLEASGINASYFAAYGGIGQIKVGTIGSGVVGSSFLANSDPLNGVAGFLANTLAQKRGRGDIKGIEVKSSGLNASGTLLSLFAGASIGNVEVAANGFPIPNPQAWIQQLTNFGNLATALQSGPILPIVQSALPQLLDFLTQPLPISSSPVTLTGFVAIKGNIGSITFTNTSRYGNFPFLGSLVYARGSYGPVTTTPVAVKAGADALAEGFLDSLGFQSPNVFTLYPLPTTFIGRSRGGGNLPPTLPA